MGIRHRNICGLGLGQFGASGGQVSVDLRQQRLALGQRGGLFGDSGLTFFQRRMLVGDLLLEFGFLLLQFLAGEGSGVAGAD
ncbi:hypothetical protein D3C73_1488060 [compost metagenome]